ncbi:hypothetical protein [Candidatus Mesenet endosymbiont of Agriotes lineatus]
MIDATIARVHQNSSGGKGGKEVHRIGRSRGDVTTKIHVKVDAFD